jgi:hypothetical protein
MPKLTIPSVTIGFGMPKTNHQINSEDITLIQVSMGTKSCVITTKQGSFVLPADKNEDFIKRELVPNVHVPIFKEHLLAIL